MGKSIWDYVAPVLGTAAGVALAPFTAGTSLAIGPALGGALGAGVGSGLATGVETGDPLAGLASGVASGAGTYAGGKLLGPVLGSLGTTTNAASGAAEPGFMGTSLAKSLGDAGLQGAGQVLGSSTPGSIAGSAIGSSVGQGIVESASPGIFDAPPPEQKMPAPWSPTRQSAQSLPTSLSGYENLDPLQQATNIASRGVYGGGQGQQEKNYFLNLINRQLVNDNGQTANDLSSINPVENSFLNQIGLGGASDPNDLLKRISSYSYS